MTYSARYASAALFARSDSELIKNIRICRALKKRGVIDPKAYSHACKLLLAHYRIRLFEWRVRMAMGR